MMGTNAQRLAFKDASEKEDYVKDYRTIKQKEDSDFYNAREAERAAETGAQKPPDKKPPKTDKENESYSAVGKGIEAANAQMASGGGSTTGALASGMTAAGAGLLAVNPMVGGGLLAAGTLTSIMAGKSEREKAEAQARIQAENDAKTRTVAQLNNLINFYKGGVI